MALVAALKNKKLVFTPDEFHKFHVSDMSYDRYIVVGERCLLPAHHKVRAGYIDLSTLTENDVLHARQPSCGDCRQAALDMARVLAGGVMDGMAIGLVWIGHKLFDDDARLSR